MSYKRTLVLNADYRPHQVVTGKRGLTLTFENIANTSKGAFAAEYYNDKYIIDTRGRKHPIPAVVVLAEFIKKNNVAIPFSRKNIFIRDKMTCQYCGNQFLFNELTLDHLIPRAEWRRMKRNGTPTRWDNIVTACKSCNNLKADKLLKDCGMVLLKHPVQPRDGANFIIGLSPWSKIEPEWENYLPSIYVTASAVNNLYND